MKRMITEPIISKSFLKQLLEENYRLSIKKITFNPKGEASWSYFIETEDKKFFLKLFKSTNFNLAPFEFTFRLFTECNIKNIVHPIKSNSDAIDVSFDDFNLVVFDFIDGKTIHEQPLNDQQLKVLGELLAKVHKSNEVIGAYSQKEVFSNPYKSNITKIYESLESLGNLNEIQEKTKQLYREYKVKFLGEQNKLEELINKLKDQDIEFVNCHGEPSPGNVMISNDGQIYLIDWDFPLYAPKEKDLLFFEKNFEQVLSGYRRIIPSTEINEDVKNYYALLWNVQEIADWGTRILIEMNSQIENKHNYDELINFLNYSGLKNNL